MRPGLREALGEFRLIGEALRFAADSLFDRQTRNDHLDGKSHPHSKGVVLIPGMMASDLTLEPLAHRLRVAGYHTFFAGILCNADCPRRTMKRLEARLREAQTLTHGKVVVIGHSLGGIYARELARRFPDMVERAILLGAPLKHAISNSIHAVHAMAVLFEKLHADCLDGFGAPCLSCGIDLCDAQPSVPETIIYTKSDGIVDWRCCLESGPNVEAVEVHSSHCGLAVSVEAWQIILDRLQNPELPYRPKYRRGDGRHLLARIRPSYLRLVKRPASAA